MKKILIIAMLGITSLFGMNSVSADAHTFNFEVYNSNFSVETNVNFIKSQKDIISKLYEDLYSKYINEYSDIYPYYSLSFSVTGSCSSSSCLTSYPSSYFTLNMFLYDKLPSLIYDDTSQSTFLRFSSDSNILISYRYDYINTAYVLPISVEDWTGYSSFQLYSGYFYSNFDVILDILNYSSLNLKLNNSSDSVLSLNNGDVFPTLHDYFDLNILSDPDSEGTSYVEVDLNNYSYVALSLKDYDVEAFDSIFYVKGQACPTVVYNYGLEERNNTDRCNIPFDDFNPIRYRISDNDINNHFIYYFKAYDTSIENKIKVDTSVFNIHYITEEEKDNPILDINGHKYSAIPFDKLSTTANKNETENFVPGASEELEFESFFDKPLEALKSVWGAITSVFSIITEFIILLPPTMQGFLYISFGIAIVLGIIKILL